MVRVPGVVVGDQGQRRVADLGLARELGLLQVRHPDDVHAPRPIQPRLGERRELRPFHVHVGPAPVHGGADVRRGVGRDGRERPAKRVREADVRDEPPAEERADAPLRAIEELVGHEDVERPVLLLEAADGARRQQALDAEHLEAEDVRPVIELRRHQPVPDAVARQERDALAAQRADHVRPGRLAEGRRDRSLLAVRELRHVVETASTNDADADVALGHGRDCAGTTRRFPCSSLMCPAATAGSCSKNTSMSFSSASL